MPLKFLRSRLPVRLWAAPRKATAGRPSFLVEGLEDRLTPAPYLVSINRAMPAIAATNASTVSFAVTFNEAVTGVDLADFQIAKTGSVATTILQVAPTGASAYTVTVSGITGDGTLGLNLVDDGSIRDAFGRSLITPDARAAFANQTTFATASGPVVPVIGDVNGDGKPDLLINNYGSDSVSVFLGNGDGTFQAQQAFATGDYPNDLALGDVNGDGKPDIAVANYNANSVSVLLGNGDGTFQTQHTFAAGPFPNSVALGDINGDGKPDIAVANYPDTRNTVSVLLGNGDGTFQPPQRFDTGVYPNAVMLADVNGDGKLDIAITNTVDSTAGILLGNGDGTFQAQQTFTTGKFPNWVEVGDVNGDGKPDLATANISDNSVSILLGNGDGTFQAHATFATGTAPYSLTRGDVNGDGKSDLVTADRDDAAVSVLLGNGNGTFQAPRNFAAGKGSIGVALGDLNGDGKSDIVVGDYNGDSVSVLLGNGNDNFTGQTYTIDHHAPPQLLSVTVNGNIASLAGPQRSRVASLVVLFDQPVQLDTDALTLALHTSNVSFGGVLQPNGYGTLPTSLAFSTTDNLTWIITFAGNTEASADGFDSLKDGVYDLIADAAKIHPLGAPGVNMAANQTTTFHRLFGDTGAPITPVDGTPGVDFQAIINSGDNLAFRASFNKPIGGGYQPFLDFNGDGIINTADNLQFRIRFNKALTWRA